MSRAHIKHARSWTDFADTVPVIHDAQHTRHVVRHDSQRIECDKTGYSRAWWIALALCTVAALAMTFFPPSAKASTIGAHIGSWHDKPGFNNVNPGLYYRHDNGATVGIYRNSIRRTSTYAGWTFERDLSPSVSAAVTVGVVTGYEMRVAPLVVPSVAVGSDAFRVRLAVIPQVHEKQGASVAHLSIETRF